MKRNYFFLLPLVTLLFMLNTTCSAQGWWYRKADFNLSARTAATGFTIGTGGYVATGFDSSTFRRNISLYNPATDSWTQMASMGGATGSGLGRDAASSFVIGNNAYVVMGQGSNPYLNDCWQYDGVADTWTQKANFGGTPRRGATGFAVNSMGYIVCGQDATGFKNDNWMYDPVANSWTAKVSFPGTARRLATVFVIGNNAFVGTGDDGAFKNDFFQYNAPSNAWAPIAAFGGTPRYGACAFTIGTDGYVGTGYDNTLSNRKDFWKFTPGTGAWVAVHDLIGSARSNAVAFNISGYGYVATGYDTLAAKDLWKYDPLSNGVDEIAKFKSSVKVYPNPMQTTATVAFDANSLNAFNKIYFLLYDINGRFIKCVNDIKTPEIKIDRDNMANGIYIYKIIADEHFIASGKIVVQ